MKCMCTSFIKSSVESSLEYVHGLLLHNVAVFPSVVFVVYSAAWQTMFLVADEVYVMEVVCSFCCDKLIVKVSSFSGCVGGNRWSYSCVGVTGALYNQKS